VQEKHLCVSSIYWACLSGHHAVAEVILKYGTDPNIQGEGGHTALHYSTVNKFIKCISLLLRYKANPNIKDKLGKTPTDLAKATKDQTIIDIFDPEKRSHVDKSLVLQEKTDVLEVGLKEAKEAKEGLEFKVMQLYKELKDQEDRSKQYQLEIQELRELNLKQEHQKKDTELTVLSLKQMLEGAFQRNKELEDLVARMRTLPPQEVQSEKADNSVAKLKEGMVIQIQTAQQSLQCLARLLGSTEVALLDAKLALNNLVENFNMVSGPV